MVKEFVRTGLDEGTYKAIEFENGFVGFQGLRGEEWRNIAMYDIQNKVFSFVEHLNYPLYTDNLTNIFEATFPDVMGNLGEPEDYRTAYSSIRWGYTPDGMWSEARVKAWKSFEDRAIEDSYADGYWFVKHVLRKEDALLSSGLLTRAIDQFRAKKAQS
jgi:hypothetical protein